MTSRAISETYPSRSAPGPSGSGRASPEQAVRWLAEEHANLVAAFTEAAGDPVAAERLAEEARELARAVPGYREPHYERFFGPI